ncbi:hypothetical protein EJ04DRAFT_234591 [Polyplosphaeria fusca]|uniref:DUF4604 domain-containing protein n=1 Tax=Polyplosphaeria fusca TaxID=682080 RepID=A0A9P4RAA8_9PLEO|nr:hypothetical protein EJ04DRAFT_234591 [Polyplosphaeria fusca]
MSFKSKNLSYDSAQPAFLQRLRGQVTGDGSGRHERPAPRNKGTAKDDDDHDAPTYVLEESSQTLTKAEYDALVTGKDPNEQQDGAVGVEKEAEAGTEDSNAAKAESKDNIAEVGKTGKKRKLIKVVGEKDEKGGETTKGKEAKASDTKAKRPKKKTKAVKLSFDDPDDG